MPPRSTWKGFVNLSLVSVAVKAFTASSEGTQIRLNQLHAECNSRIRLQKTCPQHGPVPNDELVMGYEYSKDQYVRIDLSELDKLRTPEEVKSINIDKFVKPDEVDPIYYTDSNYYLVPDGPAGQKPFHLIHRAMQEMEVYCIAQAVLHKRDQLVLIRPLDNVLCMTVLKFPEQIKTPSIFDDDLAELDISRDELALAKTLVNETTAEQVDLSVYKDQYMGKLMQLIEAKVNGEELVASPAEAPRNVINLMDALKASVSRVQQERKGSPSATAKAASSGAKPAKKSATTKKKAAKTAKTASSGGSEALEATLAAGRKKTAKKKAAKNKKTG